MWLPSYGAKKELNNLIFKMSHYLMGLVRLTVIRDTIGWVHFFFPSSLPEKHIVTWYF